MNYINKNTATTLSGELKTDRMCSNTMLWYSRIGHTISSYKVPLHCCNACHIYLSWKISLSLPLFIIKLLINWCAGVFLAGLCSGMTRFSWLFVAQHNDNYWKDDIEDTQPQTYPLVTLARYHVVIPFCGTYLEPNTSTIYIWISCLEEKDLYGPGAPCDCTPSQSYKYILMLSINHISVFTKCTYMIDQMHLHDWLGAQPYGTPRPCKNFSCLESLSQLATLSIPFVLSFSNCQCIF